MECCGTATSEGVRESIENGHELCLEGEGPWFSDPMSHVWLESQTSQEVRIQFSERVTH